MHSASIRFSAAAAAAVGSFCDHLLRMQFPDFIAFFALLPFAFRTKKKGEFGRESSCGRSAAGQFESA